VTTQAPYVFNETTGNLQQIPPTSKCGPFAGGTSTGEAMTQDQFGTNSSQMTPSGTPTFSTVTVASVLAPANLTIQPASGSDCDVALGGTLGKLHPTLTDSSVGSVSSSPTIMRMTHNTAAGTPDVGFGATFSVGLQTTVFNDQTALAVTTTWVSATHASRKSRTVFNAQDATSQRECLRIESSGLSPMIGFLGASASAQLVSPDIGTALTTFGLASGTPTFAAANLSGCGTGIRTWLATPSSANLAAAITDETGSGPLVFATSPTLTDAIINQAANGDTAIKSVRFTDTSPTGNFLDFQNNAATSIFKIDRYGQITLNLTAQASTAERLLQMGVSDSATVFSLDNGTTNPNQFNPTFNGVIEQTVDGVGVSFFATKGVDNATNPAILFLGRHNTGSGNTDLSATVPIVVSARRPGRTSLAGTISSFLVVLHHPLWQLMQPIRCPWRLLMLLPSIGNSTRGLKRIRPIV